MKANEIRQLKELKKRLLAGLTAGVMAVNMSTITNAEDKGKADITTQTTSTQEVSKTISLESLNKKVERFESVLKKVENLEILKKKQENFHLKEITGFIDNLKNDELLNRTVRCAYLDFKEHDGLNQIEAKRYGEVLEKIYEPWLIINAYTCMDYIEGEISKINIIYTPLSIFTSPSRDCVEESINLTKNYIETITKTDNQDKTSINYFNSIIKLIKSDEFNNLNPFEKMLIQINFDGPMHLAIRILDHKYDVTKKDSENEPSDYSVKYINITSNIQYISKEEMLGLIRLSNVEEEKEKLKLQNQENKQQNSTERIIVSADEVSVDDVSNPKTYQILQEINQGLYDDCYLGEEPEEKTEEELEEIKKNDGNPPTGLNVNLTGFAVSGLAAFLSRRKKKKREKHIKKEDKN